MKIAVLCGRYPYSGAGAIAWESARTLASRHEVAFVHGGDRDEERREDGMRIVTLGLPPEERQRALHLYWNPSMIRKLRETLERLAPEVVHFHIIQRRSFSLAALLLSRRHRTVWTLHDQWPLCVRSVPEPPSCEGMRRFCLMCPTWPGLSILNKLAKEAVFAAADLDVVVPSRWLRDLVRYSFLGRKEVHLVYNGVDLERFRPAADADRGRNDGNAVTLLYVAGPNDATKGIRELLPVFARLRERHPSARLRVAGAPPEGTGGVPGVEITGRIPPEAMAEEYRRADLFVLPTRADNTPVTLMEAMASGLPAISSKVGGVPEMVEPGVTGLLVPPGDAEALESTLEELMIDPARRRGMGAAARSRAESRFSHLRMASELERIYQRRANCAEDAKTPVVPAAISGGPR